MDLIYGAPGESLDDWRTSVTTAIDLGVNHISAYALTVEPTTKMGRQIAAGTLPKPNDDDEPLNTRSLTTCSPPPASNGMRSPTGLAPDTKASTTSATGATLIGPV